MKTAMQELIEYIELNIDDNDFIKHEVLEQADKLIEKEKEHIIDAYKNGYGVSFIDGDNRNFSRPQQYYNQTYNKID